MSYRLISSSFWSCHRRRFGSSSNHGVVSSLMARHGTHQLQQQQPHVQPSFHQRQASVQSFSTATAKKFRQTFEADAADALEQRLKSVSFAVIDHSVAYEDQAIHGRHGKQLALAEYDAQGKDDPIYDPFAEFELDDDVIELEHDDDDDDETDVSENGAISNSTSKKPKSTSTFEEAEYTEIAQPPPTKDMDQDTASILGKIDTDEEEEYDEENDEDDEDDEEELMYFNNDGSVPYKKSQLARFKAGAPAGGMFCVLEFPGTQYKVTVDDLIVVNKLKPTSRFQVGSVHTFSNDQVLLVGSSHRTLVGMPFVPGAEVDVMVEEITMDQKVIAFKKRRKKNSQRKKGFRRQVTLLRVLDIRMPAPYHTMDSYVPREEPMK